MKSLNSMYNLSYILFNVDDHGQFHFEYILADFF